MRKLLLGLISILLLGLSIYIAMCGISIGSLEINGIPAIQEENAKLESKIQTASTLRNSTYPQNTAALESAYKKLMSEKENYEQILSLGVDENGQPLNKIQEYEIEKIWVTMGNYATRQGVDLKMDLTSNNSISKTYDLKFTVIGGYIQIIDFLYDIERDSTLAFKIEEFKMVPGNTTEELIATFTCKDIKINITEITESDQNTTETTDKNDAENTDTATNNKTNTNNATNNKTNTNNTTSSENKTNNNTTN